MIFTDAVKRNIETETEVGHRAKISSTSVTTFSVSEPFVGMPTFLSRQFL